LIKAIYKELHNAKPLLLETMVPIPSIDEIEITILKPDLSNVNPKLAVIAQLISIIKFKKLPNPLIFNGN
jgi:hypothetical protein